MARPKHLVWEHRPRFLKPITAWPHLVPFYLTRYSLPLNTSTRIERWNFEGKCWEPVKGKLGKHRKRHVMWLPAGADYGIDTWRAPCCE